MAGSRSRVFFYGTLHFSSEEGQQDLWCYTKVTALFKSLAQPRAPDQDSLVGSG